MESFVGDLKKQVQCSLCNETMVEPKLLQCFHTFCKNCIKRNAQLDEEFNIFQCPRCTSETRLQNVNDVEDLQISLIHSRILEVLEFVENPKLCSVSSSHPLALWHCFDCTRSMCEECLRCHTEFTQNHYVVPLCNMKKEDVEKMLRKERHCKKHDSTIVAFHCQDCDMLICLLCIDEGHHNHKTKTVQELVAIEKDSMSKNLAEIEKMSTDENEKKRQEEIAQFTKSDGENAREKIKEFTKALVKTLKKNEHQLLNETQKSIKKANRNLRIIWHATQAQEYIKYFVENGTASEIFDARHDKSLQDFIYEPFEKATPKTKFKPNVELRNQIDNGLGMIRPVERSDPKMSSLGIEPTEIYAQKKAKLVVNLRTSNGEAADEVLENVTFAFTPNNSVQIGEVQLVDDSQATVDFIPRTSGPLHADVRVEGKSVSNCPLVIQVKPQEIEEMTEYSKIKEALNTGSKDFTGIAVDKTRSKIAVADWGSHCVRIFDVKGNLLLTYGSQGSGQGQLKHPFGLAFLNETDLVIADSHNHRICIVDTATGKQVKIFGKEGKSNAEFQSPCGVHINDESNIIVCDCLNNRVQVFTKDGHYLNQFSVRRPYSVVTKNGLFYFVDCSQAVVHVMALKDNRSPFTITTIGGKTTNTDVCLQAPWGAAIDNTDNLIVCDYIAFLIHKFTLDGRYVGRSSQLAHNPRCVSVLDDDVIICTTLGGGCSLFKT